MRITSKIIKGLLLAAGKKDIRHYLNGLHVNARHIVATDGCRLHAYAHGQEWPHDPVTIQREAVEMALKGRTPELEINDVSVGAVSYTPLDGKYPDYMRVIPAAGLPTEMGARHIDVNPDYLRDAVAAITLTGWKGEHPAMSRVGGAYVWCNGTFCAVVMPVRTVNPKTGEAGYQTEQFK